MPGHLHHSKIEPLRKPLRKYAATNTHTHTHTRKHTFHAFTAGLGFQAHSWKGLHRALGEEFGCRFLLVSLFLNQYPMTVTVLTSHQDSSVDPSLSHRFRLTIDYSSTRDKRLGSRSWSRSRSWSWSWSGHGIGHGLFIRYLSLLNMRVGSCRSESNLRTICFGR